GLDPAGADGRQVDALGEDVEGGGHAHLLEAAPGPVAGDHVGLQVGALQEAGLPGGEEGVVEVDHHRSREVGDLLEVGGEEVAVAAGAGGEQEAVAHAPPPPQDPVLDAPHQAPVGAGQQVRVETGQPGQKGCVAGVVVAPKPDVV